MMLTEKLKAALVFALLLFPLAIASAQTDDESAVYCSTLSPEDCEILALNEALGNQNTSVAFEMTAKADISVSFQGMPTEETNVVVTGTGKLAADTEAFDDWSDVDSDVSAEALVDILERVFKGIEGQVSLSITSTTDDETSNLTFNLRMRDGVYLLDAATLEGLMGESMGGMDWLGFDISGLFSSLAAEEEFSSAIDLATVTNEPILEEYTSIVRLPDSEVDGISVAVFEYDFDMAAAAADFEMRDMMHMAGSDTPLDEASVESMMSMLSAMRISGLELISLEDYHTYRMSFDIDIAFDGATMGDPFIDSMSMLLSLVVDLRDHNLAVDVEIPEDAFVMPLVMLMQMGN
ncbi:MAG: hypothetical protein OXG60_08595 [Chloroflexi bacterium]|nr:hypothetical protein [Chloroflexota bacterium]